MGSANRTGVKNVNFRSGLEEVIAAQLESRGIEYQYEGYTLPYLRRVSSGVCDACGHNKVSQRKRYTPDFTVRQAGAAAPTVIEVKGRFKSSDRAKMLAVREANPGLDIRFVFGADNKLEKNNDKRYSEWCRDHGFLYAIRTIPDDWFPQGKRKAGRRRPLQDSGTS